MSDLALPTPWASRGAWHGVVEPGRFGASDKTPGVSVNLVQPAGLASIVASDAHLKGIAQRLSSSCGLVPPERPAVARGDDVSLVWAGRNQWLATSTDPHIAARLADILRDVAAVADQSDARAMFRASGSCVRQALSKGCMIDLHPRAFGPGDAALTAIGHIGVHVWQVDERPAYDIVVFRSMARDFWTWFASSAAEFGLDVVRDPIPRG